MRLLKLLYLSVDGMWSQWTVVGECDRTCNTGRKLRSRSCTEPAPSGGGFDCKGEDFDWAVCNTQPCAGEKSHCLIT